MHLDEIQMHKMMVSLTEAVNNAIIHGNRSDRENGSWFGARSFRAGLSYLWMMKEVELSPQGSATPCGSKTSCGKAVVGYS